MRFKTNYITQTKVSC